MTPCPVAGALPGLAAHAAAFLEEHRKPGTRITLTQAITLTAHPDGWVPAISYRHGRNGLPAFVRPEGLSGHEAMARAARFERCVAAWREIGPAASAAAEAMVPARVAAAAGLQMRVDHELPPGARPAKPAAMAIRQVGMTRNGLPLNTLPRPEAPEAAAATVDALARAAAGLPPEIFRPRPAAACWRIRMDVGVGASGSSAGPDDWKWRNEYGCEVFADDFPAAAMLAGLRGRLAIGLLGGAGDGLAPRWRIVEAMRVEVIEPRRIQDAVGDAERLLAD